MTEIRKSDLVEEAKIAEKKINNAISEATARFAPNNNEIMLVTEKDNLGKISVRFMVDIGRIKLID